MTDLILRDYQQQTIDDVRAGFAAGHQRQIVVIPTGGGKTEIAAAIAVMAKEKGNQLWFIVDRITLAHQTKARFEKYGLSCGILQGENTERMPEEHAVVATIQTLKSRFDKNPLNFSPDIVVVDEVHNFHQMHIDLLEFRPVPTIGLTATPHNEVLGKYFTNMISDISTRQLIDDGYLVDFKMFIPSTPDLSGVRFSKGDFNESDLHEKMITITGDVVTHWQSLAENRRTIAFCVNVQHAKEMSDQFNAAGVPSGVVHGGTPQEERVELYRMLEEGTVRVLTSVYVLGTGFDLPVVSCAIMARPTASQSLYIQQAGRVARTADGKEDALILDHAGNIVRHGKPQDYRPPQLGDATKRVSKERQPKERKAIICSNCSAAMDPGQQICGSCGVARENVSDVVMVDGRLVEVDGPDPDEMDNWNALKRKQIFKEWQGYCVQQGKKSGAAVYVYQHYFGCLPWEDGAIRRYNSIEPSTPSDVARRYADNYWKYQKIKYYKGKQKASRQVYEPTHNVKME